MVNKLKCGHPSDWTIRLVGLGKRYTYCLGCLIEKLGLDNLEGYENPLIKKTGVSEMETPVFKPTPKKPAKKKVEEPKSKE